MVPRKESTEAVFNPRDVWFWLAVGLHLGCDTCPPSEWPQLFQNLQQKGLLPSPSPHLSPCLHFLMPPFLCLIGISLISHLPNEASLTAHPPCPSHKRVHAVPKMASEPEVTEDTWTYGPEHKVTPKVGHFEDVLGALTSLRNLELRVEEKSTRLV